MRPGHKSSGGLQEGLEALITLSQIDARVDARVDALLPELQQRADKQIQAYVAVLDVVDIADWQIAEQRVDDALQLSPDHPRARSALAVRLANDVRLVFYEQHEGSARSPGA